MKELLDYLFKLNFKALFLTPTTNGIIQFFRYIYVGGVAFIVDSGFLYILEHLGLHYLVATGIAFILGLIVNFLLSKILVFTENPSVKNTKSEFTIYGVIGLIGLGFTEILMYLFTDILRLYFMLSKVIVAIIVLFWNYMARKLVLYPNH